MRRGTGVRVVTVSGAGAWVLLPLGFLVGAVLGHLLAGTSLLNWDELLSTLDLRGGQSWLDREMLFSLARLLALTLILSFSAAGVVGLPLLTAAQGFAAGCTVSVLVRTWGEAGLRFAALWIGLGRLPTVAALLLAGIPGWAAARDIAAGIQNRRETWTLCLRCWVLACVLSMTGSVVFRWLIWVLLPRLWPAG